MTMSEQTLIVCNVSFNRLTPTLALLIVVLTFLLPNLNQGPVWFRLDMTIGFCKSYWWSDLLYINNFVQGGLKDVRHEILYCHSYSCRFEGLQIGFRVVTCIGLGLGMVLGPGLMTADSFFLQGHMS